MSRINRHRNELILFIYFRNSRVLEFKNKDRAFIDLSRVARVSSNTRKSEVGTALFVVVLSMSGSRTFYGGINKHGGV